MRPLVLLLGACLLASQGCATSSLDESEWFEVRTRNFSIMSALGPEATRDLAYNAELFHSTAEFVMGTSLPKPPVPTRVIAFDGRGLRRPFAVRGAGSYLHPTLRETFIVFRVGGGWSEDATPAVRHEYMHYLLENHGGFGEHLWFDEGFAQLMSTVDVRSDHVDLGHYRKDYLERLRTEPWIPVAKVLRTEDLEDWGQRKRPLFYAQSWALVHFIFFGDLNPEQGRERLRRYFREIELGSSYDLAVERAFGRDMGAFDRALHKYVRSDRFQAMGVRFPNTVNRPMDVRSVPQHVAFTRLGWLLLALEREDRARVWFESALEIEANDARAHAGLGSILDLRGEWDQALAHHERAVELAPQDALNWLDLGIHHFRRAQASSDAAEREQLLAQAREQLRKSSSLDGSLPEPLAVYGETFLLEGQDPARGVPSLERAHRLVPHDSRVELALARAYFASDQLKLARKMTLEVHAKTHSRSVRAEAEQLLREIDTAAEAS